MIKINIPQFECVFKIYQDGEEKNYIKDVKALSKDKKINFDEAYLNNICGMCSARGATIHIWLKRKGIDVAGHEFLHGIKAMCDHCSIDDEEFECFTLDYLLREYIKKTTLDWIIPVSSITKFIKFKEKKDE